MAELRLPFPEVGAEFVDEDDRISRAGLLEIQAELSGLQLWQVCLPVGAAVASEFMPPAGVAPAWVKDAVCSVATPEFSKMLTRADGLSSS